VSGPWFGFGLITNGGEANTPTPPYTDLLTAVESHPGEGRVGRAGALGLIPYCTRPCGERLRRGPRQPEVDPSPRGEHQPIEMKSPETPKKNRRHRPSALSPPSPVIAMASPATPNTIEMVARSTRDRYWRTAAAVISRLACTARRDE
jgi:hypothetical protein